jgi:hypothetical protein
MKTTAMLIFLLIIFGIHFLVNGYIYFRGIQGLEAMPHLKTAFRIIMLLFVIAYPLGRYLEKVWLSPVSDAVHWIGALWFAGMLYAFLIVFAIDIVRVFSAFFSFLPEKGTQTYITLKWHTTWISAIIVVMVVTGGFINAWTTKISTLNLFIDKEAGTMKELRIVAASDIHMGTIIAKRKSTKLVNTINGLKPDIILFAGDIVDEDVQPVIRKNLGECLLQLKAPLGVYAVTGNHEYIGGVDRTTEYLTSHGINLLRDTVQFINNAFYIAGRDDKDKQRFTGSPRKEITELLTDIDKDKPIILLDHQPFHLSSVQDAGVDLQLSGHTHHGQLWPFGYITSKIYELSRGYLKKGNTHFYVSTGFGTWGPPVRTGNRPEIVVINIKFRE